MPKISKLLYKFMVRKLYKEDLQVNAQQIFVGIYEL